MFNLPPGKRPLTIEQRRDARRVVAAVARAYAPGREERIAKAQAKRDRKDAKRARDSELQRFADHRSREALEAGAPRGFWLAGVYAHIEWPHEASPWASRPD